VITITLIAHIVEKQTTTLLKESPSSKVRVNILINNVHTVEKRPSTLTHGKLQLLQVHTIPQGTSLPKQAWTGSISKQFFFCLLPKLNLGNFLPNS